MKKRISAPQKLVSFLQGELGAYSGKFVRRLLEANVCRINGRIERFGSRTVCAGDVVELAPHWKELAAPSRVSFDILYEHEGFQIVNKPSGWICDPEHTRKAFGPGRYLVHRLDKDTTGLLMVAKHPLIRDQLMDLFEKRLIAKSYLALVDGIPKQDSGEKRTVFVKKGSFQGQTIWGSAATPAERGLTAVTRWTKIAFGKEASLLLCEPFTGRTHQIRVHMAEMGHPILQDRQYAKSFRCKLFIPRVLLHACRLQFSFEGEKIEVAAPLCSDMQDALHRVGIELMSS